MEAYLEDFYMFLFEPSSLITRELSKLIHNITDALEDTPDNSHPVDS